MNRLLTFGCSLTEGIGLANKDTQVWGRLVSDQLNLDHENQGEGGSSNKYIAHKILNFNFDPSDTVIVLWSYLHRYCVIQDDLTTVDFLPVNKDARSKRFYREYFSEYDSTFMNMVFINYTYNYLNSKNINFYFGFTTTPLISLVEDSKRVFPFVYDAYYNKYPKGLDNLHMGEEGNKAFANKVTTYLLPKQII